MKSYPLSAQYFLTVFKKVKSSLLLSYSSQSKQYITLDLLPLDALLSIIFYYGLIEF